jgi:hypothetical protein
MNTFAVMKSGFKSVDSTGSSGPISSQKAQKLIVSTLYFDIWKHLLFRFSFYSTSDYFMYEHCF